MTLGSKLLKRFSNLVLLQNTKHSSEINKNCHKNYLLYPSNIECLFQTREFPNNHIPKILIMSTTVYHWYMLLTWENNSEKL